MTNFMTKMQLRNLFLRSWQCSGHHKNDTHETPETLDTQRKNLQSIEIAGFFFLAGDEGFEPPQTESESGVLPLHKSPKWPLAEAHDYYNDFSQKVKTNFFFFAEIKTGRYGPLMVKE